MPNNISSTFTNFCNLSLLVLALRVLTVLYRHKIIADEIDVLEDELEDLYGGITGLKTGLEVLLHQLGAARLTPEGKPKNLEATRYAVNLLYLEKKLTNDPTTFRTVLQGIESAQQQLEFFPLTHPNMVARLAELYTQTISKIGPRIIIKGEQQHLANPDNAAKIRVLLLAGIRAALLWRQAGGDRWKLLFSRGKLQTEAQQLLKSAKTW